VFVFLDEHENTIEDGFFALRPAGHESWQNMPADRHSRAAGFSYAAGHAGLRKWRWPKDVGVLDLNKPTANAQDAQDLHDLQATIPR
jgi:hypothetical protein